ncbi:MAG: preprotein translocase subunit SecE [Armatimonadota bacterium]
MATDRSAATVKAAKGPAQTPGNGPFQRMKKYLDEVQVELRKTTWPTRTELISQTQVVIAVILLLGVFIYVWDTALGFVFQTILRLMGVRL